MGLAIGVVGGMVMFCILMIHNVCIEVKRIAEAPREESHQKRRRNDWNHV